MIECFRHGHSAEAMALQRVAICKYREMNRCFIEAGELQSAIVIASLAVIGCSSAVVFCFKAGAHALTHLGIRNIDDAPRLAISNRGRLICKAENLVKQARGYGLGTEPPHVTPPANKIHQ